MKEYPFVLLKEPFGQDDWAAWALFDKSSQVELVGDDLLAIDMKKPQNCRGAEGVLTACY